MQKAIKDINQKSVSDNFCGTLYKDLHDTFGTTLCYYLAKRLAFQEVGICYVFHQATSNETAAF